MIKVEIILKSNFHIIIFLIQMFQYFINNSLLFCIIATKAILLVNRQKFIECFFAFFYAILFFRV
jgi:hypothetical protein